VKSTIERDVVCGDEVVKVKFPERTRFLPDKPIYSRPPLKDLEGAIREALANPIAHDPIPKLVGKGAKVTIAFDDPAMEPTKPPGFRALCIKILLEGLDKAGVDRHDIKLVCANALHRKWTRTELAPIVGDEISILWPPQRLYCHDAEDQENLVFLGETDRGFEVEVNRVVTDSDLLIYVNITSIPFSGGWKSIVVGLSSFRSIRHHHRAFPYASGKSVMDPKKSSFQKLLWEMGAVVEKHLAEKGRRIFSIESVANQSSPPEVVAVYAGHTPQVHEYTLEVLQELQVFDVEGQCDVAVYGVPNDSGYSRYSYINPLLVAEEGFEYSYSMFQNKPLVREGGIVILANPCKNQFDEIHHPSYPEFYHRLLSISKDPYELWSLFAEDFAHRPEYVHKYRYGHGFHGVHPFFMWNSHGAPKRHVSAVFMAGVQDFDVVRHLGFEPFATVEEAIAETGERLGRDCSITHHAMPPKSIARVD